MRAREALQKLGVGYTARELLTADLHPFLYWGVDY